MANLKTHGLVCFATVLVAGSFIASAEVSDLLHPISLTLLRFVIAMFGLLPFILIGVKRQQVRSALPRGLLISLFYSAYFICFFEALKSTTPLNTGTLFTLVPFLTALVSIPILKHKMSPAKLLVYLLGVVGTTWVVFNGDIHLLLTFSLNKGDALFMVGVLSMVCYGVSMKVLYRGDNMNVFVFCSFLGGCFWMSLALILFKIPLRWGTLKGDALFYMAYLAIISTLGTSYIHQKTTILLGPARVMAYVYIIPASVAILAFIFKGKAIPAVVIPGILLSTLATVILQVLIGRSERSAK